MYICTVCLCLCAHVWVKLCVLVLFVWAYVVAVIVLTCCRVLACDWRQQVVRVGAVAPRVFFFNSFLALGRETSQKRPQKVAQVTVCRRSEHYTVFIGCQHQRCPHYCLGQGRGATLSLKKAPYCLQRVRFVASRLTIFPALPRTMDRSNAKLGEGVKHLFWSLLAVPEWNCVCSYFLYVVALFWHVVVSWLANEDSK